MKDIEEKNKKDVNNEEDSKIKKFFKELLPYVIIIIVVIFVKNYIIAPVQVKGDSMYSTLLDGDIMILNRLQYKRYGVERFDIVVIESHGTYIIKRVIGIPGDTIEFKDNVLYVNDKEYEEYYLDKGTITNDFIVAVPEDSYFVLGDNREESMDSRLLGFIDEEDIQGIAELTIFPLNRLGNKK